MTKKRKTKKEKFNIYLIVVSIIVSWLSITTILLMGKYDILPFKYFLPMTIILLLLPGLLVFLMLRKKIKKGIKKTASGFAIFLSILLAILLFYLNKTFNFINGLTKIDYTIENYSVIVMKNSTYNEIENLESKTLGYYNNETSQIGKALEELDKKIKTDKKENDDYDRLIESLYNNELDAIIIEESYRGIIEEAHETFNEDTKVIYTIEVKKDAENIIKNVDVKKETFNIYISGIDTYGNISSVSRSDVNIIATVNPITHQILLTTIPRDYYVQLDGTTGYKDKLTHAGIYGIEKSIKTIENLLDIEINYYVKVNFSSVEKIVEALGGVDVYSQYTFTGASGTNFIKGYNRVNGKQALEFARTRKTIFGGDRTRGQNQQALIQAMLNKACSKEIITKYTSILNSLNGTFQTNMPTDEMTDLIKKQLDEMASWNVTSISLDGSNGREYTYSYKSQQLYVMIPDETTIENAKQKISEVVSGEKLEGSYIENNGSVNTPTKQEKPKEEKKTEPIQETKKEETTKAKEKTLENKETTTVENKKAAENKETTIEKQEQPKEQAQKEEKKTEPINETSKEEKAPIKEEIKETSSKQN